MNKIQKQVLEKAYEVEFESDGSDMICLAVIMYLEDNVKFSTKATTLDELQTEKFIIYNKCKQELLEQFQYDVYVMKKYPKRIREIISVTGYAKALTDDEDIELDFKIIDTIEYKIIKTHPDKKLQKQWFDKNDFIHECGMTRRFIEEHMMEKKQ